MNGDISSDKVTLIQRLYEESEVGRRFLNWAASRQRDAAETEVITASNVTNISQKEIRTLFKEMENIGLGSLIEGRKGNRTRFSWVFSLKSIGKAATKQVTELKDIDISEITLPEELDVTKSVESINDAPKGMITHTFQVRSDLSINVSLPSDLNSKEADRISAWIKTLPFQ